MAKRQIVDKDHDSWDVIYNTDEKTVLLQVRWGWLFIIFAEIILKA